MAIACSPVDSFDRGVENFRSAVRESLPFTFIAYRSLIPEKDDDWYYLAQKVAWFVFIVFNFVEFAGRSISPIFYVLPFVPMIIDAIWFGSQYLQSSQKSALFVSSPWFNSIQMIGIVAFSAMGICLVFQKVRPS
jgi:hypothetical protein